MFFVPDDDVIRTFPANRSDNSFAVRVLPGRSGRDENFFDSHVSNTLPKMTAVDSITIAQKVARLGSVCRKSLDRLLSRPPSRGMFSHIEVKDSPSAMPFSRKVEATALPTGSQLTADMVGIGLLFAAEASEEPNIEDTLLAASLEGLESDDLRVLAVLTTWIEVHHSRVHADRLLRSLKTQPSPRVLAYWASIGSWLGKDRRLARLTAVYSGRRIDLLRTGTSFQLVRQGEDSRLQGTSMRVPAGILRDRRSDVLSPVELARPGVESRWGPASVQTCGRRWRMTRTFHPHSWPVEPMDRSLRPGR